MFRASPSSSEMAKKKVWRKISVVIFKSNNHHAPTDTKYPAAFCFSPSVSWNENIENIENISPGGTN
ncbi:hypothetical protein EYF80_034124 [Liparis tanakae]|uniref:Uncharacterized protein n=1 Tax=Liparis tanakae TaxID=230148 RepID=A0A4Z2GQN4_9TELE|nr:hypothetical protein EYF80_034124 [Liparis tanakae]